jgi:hypothetical protein
LFVCFLDISISPWVGNAVGALNHKFFVLFIFYTVLSCLFCLFLMLVRAIHCGVMIDDDASSSQDAAATEEENKSYFTPTVGGKKEGAYDDQPHHYVRERTLRFLSSSPNYARQECHGWYDHTAVMVLFITSLIFLIFTCCMLVEQFEAIETNASKIARMKMRVGQAGTELSRVTEEFNEMFGGKDKNVAWHWFLPLSVDFPRGMRKVVLGYEWDETFDPVPYDEDERGTAEAAAAAAAAAGFDEEQGQMELTPRNGSDDVTSAAPPVAAPAVSNLKSPPSYSIGLDTPSAVAAAAAADSENGSKVKPFTKKSPSSAERTLTKRVNSRASSKEHLDVNKGTLA